MSSSLGRNMKLVKMSKCYLLTFVSTNNSFIWITSRSALFLYYKTYENICFHVHGKICCFFTLLHCSSASKGLFINLSIPKKNAKISFINSSHISSRATFYLTLFRHNFLSSVKDRQCMIMAEMCCDDVQINLDAERRGSTVKEATFCNVQKVDIPLWDDGICLLLVGMGP